MREDKEQFTTRTIPLSLSIKCSSSWLLYDVGLEDVEADIKDDDTDAKVSRLHETGARDDCIRS